MTVEYSLTDAEHLPYVRHGLLEVHREVWGDAQADTFDTRLTEAAAKPGWTAAIGYENGRAVGYCHGFSLAADTDWWSGLIVPLPKYVTWETGQRTAVLGEIAVREPWRGSGVAAQLHEVWLSLRPEERVTLLVDSELGDGALQAACEAWGYRRVADRRERRASTVYTAMIRPVRRP
ncbi:GNAT family N-acetyltransferase [Streptomyces crystallinus]|uniref:N-acetyltransferase domain-containing protein n=1 Tax=Streptomyces crystallinus TaxID=68191 RepID=A0ABP3RTI8_9ACTN